MEIYETKLKVDKLQEVRLALGISMESSAKVVGKTRQWLRDVELGKHEPKGSDVLTLLLFYGYKKEDLHLFYESKVMNYSYTETL